MQILVLNGSPRKGNSVAAINAFVGGASKKHEVEVVDAYQLKVSPCMGCGACQCYKGCVAKDDSNMIVDKMVAADMILFVSPVYWWGITAQLKLVIDLIRGQFNCISNYLGWDILFHKDYYASAKDDLLKDKEALAELEAEGKNV